MTDTDTDELVFPFGKHKGRPIWKIRTTYLVWALHQCDGLDGELIDAIRNELDHREDARDNLKKPTPEQHAGVAAWRAAWRTIVRLGHPDRGGDEELFKVLSNINDAMNGKE